MRCNYSSRTLIAAVGSDGSVFASLLKKTNNSETFCCFILLLIEQLDLQSPTWINNTVLLIDNCPAHSSKLTQDFLTFMNVPRCLTAPASYRLVPVKLLFARIKNHKIVIGSKPPFE